MWRRSGAGDGSTVAVVASRKWRRLGDGAAEVRRREGSDGGDDGSAAHRLQSIELGGSEVCAGVPAFAVAAGAGGEIQAVMPNARLLLSCGRHRTARRADPRAVGGSAAGRGCGGGGSGSCRRRSAGHPPERFRAVTPDRSLQGVTGASHGAEERVTPPRARCAWSRRRRTRRPS